MKPMNPEETERLVHSALRSLPNRRAPATLEARVLAALEMRARIPWWHQSWSYWPQWVRAVFLVFCGSLAGVFVLGGLYIHAGFDATPVSNTLAPVASFIEQLRIVGRAGADVLAVVGRNIPMWWIYGAVAFVAALYAMLFGLGAAAYRTLWANR